MRDPRLLRASRNVRRSREAQEQVMEIVTSRMRKGIEQGRGQAREEGMLRWNFLATRCSFRCVA
jgi:hypothetical protein